MADETADPLAELERAKALAKADPRIGQLVKAARKGDVKRVRELLASGADPNQYDPFDDDSLLDPPLMVAVFARQPEVVRVLAEAGASLTPRGPYDPLVLAAGWGHLELIEALLESGADVNRPDRMGATPLYEAVHKKHPEAIAVLLKAGADPHLVTDRMRERGNTSSPLEYATYDKTLLDVFVASGALGSDPGPMLLCGAASRGDLAEVKRLLAEGVAVDAKDGQGRTALTSAALAGHGKVVEWLIKQKADVNLLAGKGGDTPLVAAVCSGKVSVVATVVAAGGTDGLEMALDIAKEERLKKITEYLLTVKAKTKPTKKGAKPKAPRTGVPTFDLNDACLLVEAPVETVAEAFKKHVKAKTWKPDVHGETVKLSAQSFAVFRQVGQPWSIVMRLSGDNPYALLKTATARELSKSLKARVMLISFGDTSGIYQYITFDKGKPVELFDTGSAANDTDPDVVASRFIDWYDLDPRKLPDYQINRTRVFASSLRKLKLAGVKNALTFINDHLAAENAFVPFFEPLFSRPGERRELTIEGFGPDDIERLDYVAM